VTQISAVAECQALVTAFAFHVDRFDGEKVVNLFTRDATFERKGEMLRGHEEIRAAQGRRTPETVVVRHVCAPSHIEVLEDGHARGTTYFQIYRAARAEGGPEGVVLPMPEPEVLGQFEDEFVQTEAGWRISARRARGIFRRTA
jgi:hypothetical protein